jgi:hypothetical protein
MGMWLVEPKLLSDTTQYAARFGSIEVSPSGDTIVIVVQANYEYTVGDTLKTVHSIFFTKSTDGGTTFSPMDTIVDGEDFLHKIEDTHAMYYAESPSINIGTDGYLFVECLAWWGDEWGKVYTVSTDLGETWSTPEFLPRPADCTPASNWWAHLGNGIVVDNAPYTAVYFTKAGEGRRVYEYHLENGDWVYQPVSPPPGEGIFGDAEQVSYGVDAEGRIYLTFADYDAVMGSDRNAFVVGSPNGGIDWSDPIRVTQTVAGPDTHYVIAVQMAENVGDVGYVIYEDAGWWETPTAVWFATFDPAVIFDPTNFPPKISDVTNYGNTYNTTGTYDIEAKIHDETEVIDTKLFYAIGEDVTEVPMTPIGDEIYTASIPAQEANTRIEYWVRAVDNDANFTLDPGTAPEIGYAILVLPGGVVAYDDGISAGAHWWEDPQGEFAVRFTPTEAAVETLTTVQVFIHEAPDTFILHLRPEDSGRLGYPDLGVDLITPITVVPEPTDTLTWVDVDIPELFVPTEDFFVSLGFVHGDQPRIGFDESMTYTRSKLCNLWGWYWWDAWSDLLIRAIMPGYGVGIEEGRTSIYRLSQNLPNPMLKATTIEFAIPKKEHVNLAVYNVAGQKVKTLVDGDISPGSYTINWNGKDKNGRRLAAGVYFYRIEAGKYISTRKLVLLR